MSNSIWEESWGSIRNAILGSSAAFVFGLVILVISLVSATNPLRVLPAEVPVSPVLATSKVQYYLVYPGILPDNPLYRFKAIRDWAQMWLTPDGEDKAKLALSLADKRLSASLVLFDGGQATLGVSTVTKAEKYLQIAVDQAAEQVKQGKDVKSILLTLMKASAKHVEVVAALVQRSSGEERLVLEDTLKQSQVLVDRVSQAFRDSK